ncbi:hypothetical protein LINPERHAP2_LOCUS14540, partial [Linum perenne]
SILTNNNAATHQHATLVLEFQELCSWHWEVSITMCMAKLFTRPTTLLIWVIVLDLVFICFLFQILFYLPG